MLDNLFNKVGPSRVLHFFCGGYVCALISFIVILQEEMLNSSVSNISAVLVGTSAVFVLSLIKGLIIDTKLDWKNILASMLGCVLVIIAVAIGVLFNNLSH